jgi:tetratricopeptide (TPR) repeat protein
VTIQPSLENRLVCPNCQALNTPHAIICTSCGVNIEEFRAALPRLKQMKANSAIWHREQLEDEKTSKIQDDVKKSKLGFYRLILFLFLGVVLVGVVLIMGTIFYANHVKQTRAELQSQYDSSIACLQAEQYLCARDGFQKLLASGEDFPDLEKNLNLSQFGLAQQYFNSGQWESAVRELKTLLQNDPGNQKAVDMLKASYDHWIEQLGLEGKWFQKWVVHRERDARFPPGDK